MNYLEFEKPLAEIEGKAEELRAMARANREMDVEKEAAALDRKAETLLKDHYKSLTPWQKCREALPCWRGTGTLPMTMRSWAGWRGSTMRR